MAVGRRPRPRRRPYGWSRLTPPESGCSIAFGKGLTKAEPGSTERFELVVDDIEAARDDLISRGVKVSELFHLDGGSFVPGPDPERRPYLTYASFSDPDGNGWAAPGGHDAASGPLGGVLFPHYVRKLFSSLSFSMYDGVLNRLTGTIVPTINSFRRRNIMLMKILNATGMKIPTTAIMTVTDVGSLKYHERPPIFSSFVSARCLYSTLSSFIR